MNWLQRNLPSRESWAWVILTLASVLAYLSAHFAVLQAAFDLTPRWESRIELFAGLLGFLAAKQSFSWMPTKENQVQARLEKSVERELGR